MIISEFNNVNGAVGCKVKLGALHDIDQEMQEAEFELELSSIYVALQKQFGFDTAISIMTNATKLFMTTQD